MLIEPTANALLPAPRNSVSACESASDVPVLTRSLRHFLGIDNPAWMASLPADLRASVMELAGMVG